MAPAFIRIVAALGWHGQYVQKNCKNRCDGRPARIAGGRSSHHLSIVEADSGMRRQQGIQVVLRVGLISDTHGLLRTQAADVLRGSNHIIHAGDVGNKHILKQLAALAPVTVVRGNNDTGEWADALPESALIQVGNVLMYVLHDLALLDIDPKAAGVQVVVSGHSHKPRIEERQGVLYVNPGSAGPRRFRLPIAVAELVFVGQTVTPRIVELSSEDIA
jgi:putative phosphoesterase